MRPAIVFGIVTGDGLIYVFIYLFIYSFFNVFVYVCIYVFIYLKTCLRSEMHVTNRDRESYINGPLFMSFMIFTHKLLFRKGLNSSP